MGEIRGGHFDRRLEKSFTRHYKHGTSYVRRDVMQRRLTSSKIKMRTKEKNISGLQIADILAHPSALYIRSQNTPNSRLQGFGAGIAQLLVATKYNRSPSGQIEGWGTKWLP